MPQGSVPTATKLGIFGRQRSRRERACRGKNRKGKSKTIREFTRITVCKHNILREIMPSFYHSCGKLPTPTTVGGALAVNLVKRRLSWSFPYYSNVTRNATE